MFAAQPLVQLKAQAKFNLNLFILGQYEDGLHELNSLFIPLNEPCDYLRVYSASSGFNVECMSENIDNQANILTKAYNLYVAKTGFAPTLQVLLEKNIPIGAGLGGGSSDAAVFLNWLNAQNPTPLAKEELLALATKVGADVPFFFYNSACQVAGIGDKITPLINPLSGYYLVLICPNVHVSTAWAYKTYDNFNSASPNSLLTKLYFRDKEPSSYALKNCFLAVNNFEPVVFKHYPLLRELKEQLYQLGATCAVMSGSGSSLGGIFASFVQAESAVAHFKKEKLSCYLQKIT